MISYGARSVGTAVARVPALSVDAGLCVAALVVRRASADYCYLDWKIKYL